MASRFQLDSATSGRVLELGNETAILAAHRTILPQKMLMGFYRHWQGNHGQQGDLLEDWMQTTYDLLRHINDIVSSGSEEENCPGFTLWW